ncbi:serine protease persephone-like [Diorhabda carinulata]|uniref:serine protease persephone-like n=1 Tax=Diorhabda carinulata TaxID=1163345 RepID=UPI0025A089F3|nr:serine protease persephone-like [Diorhabda carinulata]
MEKHILLAFCVGTVIYVSCLAFEEYDNYDVGDECRAGNTRGICKSVSKCPVALNSLRKLHKHNLKRCLWDNSDEIVCCPGSEIRGNSKIESITNGGNDDSEETTTTLTEDRRQSNKRKAEQACDNVRGSLKANIIFHITDGEDAKEKEYPHMVALGFEDANNPGEIGWNCGASLISSKFLLTAAHCLDKAVKPTKARLGVTKLNDTNHVDIDIRNIKMHEDYNPLLKVGDIGLVELAKEVTFSNRIKPACLYTNETDPLGLLVTGWGKTSFFEDDNRSNILQVAKLVPVSVPECNNTIFSRSLGSKTIDSSQICAWGNTSDACGGDSGGPLQIKDRDVYSIVGIVSYGSACGGSVPGVYTRVSKYLDWIEKYVWPRF